MMLTNSDSVIKTILLFGAFLLASQTIISQPPPPAEFNSRITYFEMQKTTYFTKDMGQLSTLEKLSIRPSAETRRVERFTINDERWETRITITSPNTRFADWMETPSLYIIDEKGTTAYHKNGKKLAAFEHSKDYVNTARHIRVNQAVTAEFAPVSSQQINELTNNGVGVTRNGTTVVMRYDNERYFYDATEKFTGTNRYDNNGNLKTQIRKYYTTTNNGYTVLSRSIETTFPTLLEGSCVEKSVENVYWGHTFEGLIGFRSANDPSDNNNLHVFPNPAATHLQIHFKTFPDTEKVKLEVFNQFGVLVESTVADNSGQSSLGLNKLPKGVYYLHLSNDKQQQITKFFKN